MYRHGGKRALDVALTVVALVPLLPICLVLAAVVGVKLGHPVLFRQSRPGRHRQPFRIVKFRTMTDATDADGNLLPDEYRLTRFGAMLRSTSLDEVPELWNVLRGEMSLVGPRPLLNEYLDRYTPEQDRRHDVRPGLTGWAQVNGRNNTPWDDRLAMDVWYTEHYSLGLDIRIMWRTVWTVLRRADVAQDGHATATQFPGGPR